MAKAGRKPRPGPKVPSASAVQPEPAWEGPGPAPSLPAIQDGSPVVKAPLAVLDLSAPAAPGTGVPHPLAVGSPIRSALSRAFNVDPMAVAAFQPTPDDIKVGEAISAGLVHVPSITAAAGIEKAAVMAVLNNPVAMLWISQRIEALFRYRAGLVDAALFMRAVGGDVTAIKLFFERHKIMSQDKNVNLTVSGGIDVRGLPDDELRKIIADKARALPADFRVLSSTKIEEPDAPKP